MAMTVGELKNLLAELDSSATVVVEYEAGSCMDDDLGLRLDGELVVIETNSYPD